MFEFTTNSTTYKISTDSEKEEKVKTPSLAAPLDKVNQLDHDAHKEKLRSPQTIKGEERTIRKGNESFSSAKKENSSSSLQTFKE